MILKSAIEDLFGSNAWYALKESNHIPTWRKYAINTIRAIELSIKDTIEIYDEDWISQIEECVLRGKSEINRQKSIDEIIGVLAGILINISFLQIGSMPSRKGSKEKYQLRKGQWRLDGYRSVVYLQTPKQRENYFLHQQRKSIGLDAQQKLLDEYHNGKRKLSFEQWCKEQGKA